MARAARLRGAAQRAFLLSLLLLLLLPRPLLARAPRPPVSACRPAAPRPGSAGHAGWAQWRSWTHGDARGGLEQPVTQNAFWVPVGVIDRELPVPGGVQVEPARGSLRLVRRGSALDARPLPAWGPAPRCPRCRLGCVLVKVAEGVVTGLSILGRDKAKLVSASRCVGSVNTPPGVQSAGGLRKSWGGQQLHCRRCYHLGTYKWQVWEA